MIDDSIAPCESQRSRRIRLRAAVLRIGARLGWEPHEAIAFTEALTGCPWRRCGCDEFEAVLEEYLALGRVIQEKARRRKARRQDRVVTDGEGAVYAAGT
jgi:hypothetical protein